MGKAYSEEQRNRVKSLLEAGRDEDAIEKDTGVSDRTIRRWKLELERTGRIGKPPESRTGRHRVLNPEIEAALVEYVRDKPEVTVDDMLWWLYETYKIVVGTRTIRRVFERKDNKPAKGRSKSTGKGDGQDDDDNGGGDAFTVPNNASQPTNGQQYQSPYAPLAQQTAISAEQQLAQVLQQQSHHPQTTQPPHTPHHSQYSMPSELDTDLPDDEETIQLQLQQIALQKREVELKLKMRRLQQHNGQSGKSTPASSQKRNSQASSSGTSSLYNPNAVIPQGPKRDSRSKKKIEESKRRTAERQERMLRDLERRSRRRDHLTAEWVSSKDIWPLRAQGMLADLMHQYSCYAFNSNQLDNFEAMYGSLYQLVDLRKGDWVPQIHDGLLRERMKRKMGQLRAKMQKSGEIVGRTDGFEGFQKADNYTGEQAGAAIGDESEIVPELQTAPGAPQMQDDQMHYGPVPDHQQMQAPNMSYAHSMMNQGPPQYPLMDQNHPGMLPYGMSGQMGGQMNGGLGI